MARIWNVPAPDGPRPAWSRMLRVAGVAGGVGTTTVATALGGVDHGVFAGRPVDVLVCRATSESLIRAGRVVELVAADGGSPPVVAVTGNATRKRDQPVRARLRLLEPHVPGLVELPYVPRWRNLPHPLGDVRGLLTRPRTELTRDLARYADAITAVRATAKPGPLPHRPAPTASAPTVGRRPPTCAR